MLVSDIMSRDFLYLKPSDPVTKFISMMEMEHVHEVPLLDGKKFKGMVNFESIASKGITDPSRQKLASIVGPKPASLEGGKSLDEAATLLLQTGLRALPVMEKGNVIGLLSITDVVRAAADTRMFKDGIAKLVMSKPETVTLDTDIGSVRVLMRQHNVSRIPVVDDKGDLAGIVTVFDLVQSLKQPKEKMGWFSMAAEMDRVANLPVSIALNKNPVVAKENTKLSDVVGLMEKYRNSGVVITDGKKPIGIVTLKDLLEYFVSGFQKEGIYYQVIGLDEEDEFTLETVDRMIRDVLKKIASVEEVQFFFVHFKKYKSKGLKTKYSVRIRLRTGRDLFTSRSWAWDARDAVGEGLDNLEREVFKERGMIKTKLFKNLKKLKGLRSGN